MLFVIGDREHCLLRWEIVVFIEAKAMDWRNCSNSNEKLHIDLLLGFTYLMQYLA